MNRTAFLPALALAAAAPCQMFFPAPLAPAANPPTVDKGLLGMALFWEEQLSSTNTVACGSCHGFARGGGDPRAFAAVHPGPDGEFGTEDDIRGSRGVSRRTPSGHYEPSLFGFAAQVTPRKAPTVVNAAYNGLHFYDGRTGGGSFVDPISGLVTATGNTALERMVLEPPVNPIEMGHPGRTWHDVVAKLTRSRPLALARDLPPRLESFVAQRNYEDLFALAFGSPGITPTRVAFAIATYMRTLIADQSKFDLALRNQAVLTPDEAFGRQLFETAQGAAASCRSCHGDVSLQSHTLGPGSAQPVYYNFGGTASFHNIGMRPVEHDVGRAAVTGLAADRGRFKVPMLRNVGLQATLGHAGTYRSLAELVEFYDRGGDYHQNQSPQIQPRLMTPVERAALVVFLHTLTDPRVASEQLPFDRPRLASENGASLPAVFGVGTAGTAGRQPGMLAADPVFVGADRVTLGIHNALPSAFAFAMFDVMAIQEGFTNFGPRLYLHFVQFQLLGAGQLQQAPDGSGYTSITFTIPGNPLLRGMELYAQWLILDPAGPGGAATSPAARLVVR